MRSIACRSSPSPAKRTSVASSRPCRSTQAGAVPETRISSTSGSARSGSSGPSPNDRSAIRATSAARERSSSTDASRSTNARIRSCASSGAPGSTGRASIRSRREPARPSRAASWASSAAWPRPAALRPSSAGAPRTSPPTWPPRSARRASRSSGRFASVLTAAPPRARRGSRAARGRRSGAALLAAPRRWRRSGRGRRCGAIARVCQPAKPRDCRRIRRPARGTCPPRTRPVSVVVRPRRWSRTRTAARTARRSVTVAPRCTSRTWRDGPTLVNVVRRPSRRVRTPVIGRQARPRRRSSIRTGVCASGRPRRSVRRPRIRTRVGHVTVVRRSRRRPRSSQALRRARGWVAPRTAPPDGTAAGTRSLSADATRTVPPPSLADTTARSRRPASRERVLYVRDTAPPISAQPSALQRCQR